MSLIRILLLAAASTAVLCAQGAYGLQKSGDRLRPDQTPAELQNVEVTEHLGGKIDLDLQFVGEDGYPHRLREYFQKGRPVLVTMVYYTCPMLCNLVLNSTVYALREIPWTPGQEFEVLTISIDPTEHFGMAREKKAAYMASYDRPAPGWHFMADYEGNAKKLSDQLGFGYKLDPRSGQYAHPAVIFVLSPDGMISRYLYGARYKAFDIRMALTEAAKGKSGLTVEKVLLYCFHYDPEEKSYVLAARNLMRLGGVLTVLIFGFVLWRLWRGERARSARSNFTDGETVTAK